MRWGEESNALVSVALTGSSGAETSPPQMVSPPLTHMEAEPGHDWKRAARSRRENMRSIIELMTGLTSTVSRISPERKADMALGRTEEGEGERESERARGRE